MQRRSAASLASVSIVLLLSGAAAAQETPAPKPQETTPPSAPEAPRPPKAPEGSIIITLNGTEVAPAGNLGILFTHRFSSPVQGSDIHSLFSFDSGADIGIGLQYVPVSNLEVAVLRNKSLEDYEFSAKYRLPAAAGGVLTAALRGGVDYRGQSNYPDHESRFGQAILGVTLFERVRLTVIPTYVSDTAGQITGFLVPAEHDVFNVPLAFSAAVTSSFNVHAEYVPRHLNPGAGWIVSVEKTLLRHRFAFTAGNLRPTTVDQYISYDFQGLPKDNIYLGFNIVRLWKVN